MRKTRTEVAQAVADHLIPLEEHIDGALVHRAHLQIAVIEGRRRGHLALDTGQRALDLAASAETRLLEARAAIHEAHIELRQVMVDMGVQIRAYGDFGDTPTGGNKVQGHGLSVVNAEAA